MAKIEQRKFQYQRSAPEAISHYANMKSGDYDSIYKPGIKIFKPREGKNIIRILPPTWPDARSYAYEMWVNYKIGVDDQQYLSLSKMFGKRDPLQEARRQAESEGDKKLADSLRPKQRFGVHLIDRMNEDEGPQFWSMPQSFLKDIANVSFDEDTKEIVYIDDPEGGCDLRFYREGTGLNTEYPGSKMKLMKPSRIHENDNLQNNWLNYVQNHPIPDCLNFYDYDHISNVFNGGVNTKSKDLPDEKPERQLPKTEVVSPIDDETDETENDTATVASSLRDRLAKRSRPVLDDEED